jgi:glucan-binding YG repeat protein
MVTGFQNIDGDCFYFKPDGALQAGWQLVDGVWYYFNPNHDGNYGAMRKGWQEINGEWYYLDPTTGACQTGWIENPAGSDTWYYLNTANEGTYGAMHHGGWMKLGNKWYYLNPKADGYYGRQIQGWVTDGGQKYYMQKSGNPAEAWMLTGRVVGITEWQTDTGSYNYYFDPDGHMVTNADRGGYHYGPDGKET